MSIVNMGQEFVESDGEIFPVAPAGLYNVRITGVEDKETGQNSKHPGSPMWKIAAVIDEEGNDAHGIRITWFQMLPADWMDTADRKRRINEIKRLWMACDLDASDGEIDSDDLMHATLRLNVGVEDYNGKQQNNVRDTLPVE